MVFLHNWHIGLAQIVFSYLFVVENAETSFDPLDIVVSTLDIVEHVSIALFIIHIISFFFSDRVPAFNVCARLLLHLR